MGLCLILDEFPCLVQLILFICIKLVHGDEFFNESKAK